MQKITIFHNPSCSKSRKALDILKKHTIALEIIEYLKTPLNELTLRKILKLLDLKPRELMRTNEKIYQELGLNNTDLKVDELIKVLTAHPILIQRPIIASEEKAIIGRPPEAVLKILKPVVKLEVVR